MRETENGTHTGFLFYFTEGRDHGFSFALLLGQVYQAALQYWPYKLRKRFMLCGNKTGLQM